MHCDQSVYYIFYPTQINSTEKKNFWKIGLIREMIAKKQIS